jgi:hypothetical protein
MRVCIKTPSDAVSIAAITHEMIRSHDKNTIAKTEKNISNIRFFIVAFLKIFLQLFF